MRSPTSTRRGSTGSNCAPSRPAATQNPQPQATGTAVPTGTTNFWLRLTKTGTTYKGEYSFDGTTWVSTFATVANTQTAPKFGVFALGVQAAGAGKTVTFDYFKVNGQAGCGSGGPVNASPVITSATASNTAGIAPLATTFTAAATDADNDALTYSWDFDGNGTADATGASASTTYTTAGTKTAKLTVTDGKGGTATRDVTVTVLARHRHHEEAAGARLLQDGGLPARPHPDLARRDPDPRALNATGRSTLPRTARCSRTRSWPTTTWWSSTPPRVTSSRTAQQAAFERFIRSGKGYFGLHAAADGEYGWAWYGQLVGAYFRNHPAGTPTATVLREDKTDPSTAGLPDAWSRTDEWYNYQSPVNPVVNGGGTDYNPRNTEGTHVLLTMDETTYDEDDGNTTDDDHPIAWCKKFDGGRMFYTGMGHTQASYAEAGIRSHIAAGIEIAAGKLASAACGVAPANANPVISAALVLGDLRCGSARGDVHVHRDGRRR